MTDRLVKDLRRPEAYSHSVGEVGFLQTHISWLFFAGQRVYKVKKPVDFGFLDFTTPTLREHFCREEVRLNRRLAPEVYLGVVPVLKDASGSLRIGAAGDTGEVVDWAVEMVRLPAERMLSELLDRASIDNAEINAIVDLIAGFHAAAPTGPGVDEHGSLEAVTYNVEENFEQIRQFTCGDAPLISATQLEHLARRQHGFLVANAALFGERVRTGRIREGHGDLHAGNLCLMEEGVVAYDCIEFNRRFRCGDVAAELAFLAMDLDQRGYPSFSRYFVKRYADVTADPELRLLTRFYKTYRAIVRGKVAALTTKDPSLRPDRRANLGSEARRYFQLAASYELPPALVLVAGEPSAAKTHLAEELARPLRASVFLGRARRREYRDLLSDVQRHLEHGWSVVFDAAFETEDDRRQFVDAVRRMDLSCAVVDVAELESQAGNTESVCAAVIDHRIALLTP